MIYLGSSAGNLNSVIIGQGRSDPVGNRGALPRLRGRGQQGNSCQIFLGFFCALFRAD